MRIYVNAILGIFYQPPHRCLVVWAVPVAEVAAVVDHEQLRILQRPQQRHGVSRRHFFVDDDEQAGELNAIDCAESFSEGASRAVETLGSRRRNKGVEEIAPLAW